MDIGTIPPPKSYELEGRIIELEREVNQMRSAVSEALTALDASLFANAEHARAKNILRNTLREGSTDG